MLVKTNPPSVKASYGPARNDGITHIFNTVCIQVLIYTAESTRASMERTKIPNLRNGSKEDSNPGSLDCEYGILPLSYRAPYIS